MRAYDFEKSIGYWMFLGSHGFFRALSTLLAPHGVTYRQSQVLGWLALREELTQSELATLMMIEPPSLVGVLDRMEQMKLIQRTPCAKDRRKRLIRLTDAASGPWEKVVEAALQVRAAAAEGLSASELKQLTGLLKRVSNNLDQFNQAGCPTAEGVNP